MTSRVTYSRNFTLSLSRTCQCYCKYCSFATHQAHLHEPDEVESLLDVAVKRHRAKELLVLTGERPEVNPQVAEHLHELGFEDFVGYVIWVCEQALKRGLLPHTNLGVLEPRDLARLREVTASQGLMLESINPDLVAHQGSPTKRPEPRLQMMRDAGELKIPFTTGLLVGIGESREERIAGLEAIAEVQAQYGNIQEVIIQNFVPHQRYYGQEPAQIASQAAQQYWQTGIADETVAAMPAWATEVTIDDLKELVVAARKLMPEVGVQIPPNLSQWWPELVAAGATDLGGLSANGDHISPEQPFPSPTQVRKQLTSQGAALSERLCVYPQYINPKWLAGPVLDLIRTDHWSFIPRGARVRQSITPAAPEVISRAVSRAVDGEKLTPAELTALFAEQRPEAIEEIRLGADQLRRELVGETVTFVVNRNLNISNICTVGCAFCGFSQSRRSVDAYQYTEDEVAARVREAVAYGATELCIQSGIRADWTIDDYERWLRFPKSIAPELHLHAWSPMEIDYASETSGLPLDEVFARMIEAGLGSTPGTAAEILEDKARAVISPNKLPVKRWVEVIEAAHRAGLHSTATIMFGHIEEPWQLAEHMRVVREVQERTGGFTEFVPLPFVPYQTLLGRTYGIDEISPAENLKDTAIFRLALGKTVKSLQVSWVKMGVELATQSLDWGVNDLGGTLMEEAISRLAGSSHGVKLDPEDLIAAAHAAGRPAAQRTTLYEILREYPVGTTVGIAA
jgi:FO synthase